MQPDSNSGAEMIMKEYSFSLMVFLPSLPNTQ